MPLRFGACTFDAQSRELRRDGTLVPLSPKAFRLLELLVEARPNPVSRETLYATLWPDVVVEPGNLHGLVSEVRAATGDPATIRTVHRVGYAFAAATVAEEGARFSVLLGDDEIPLRSGENVIGRDPRDAVVIQLAEVSRHHARLLVTGTAVMLEDLGSKNGTWYQGQRIGVAVALMPGEEFIVGGTKLRLVRVDPQARTATAG